LRIHFINLDRSKDRLAEFRSVNGNLTDAVRFPAIEGRSLDIQALARDNVVTADVLNTYHIGAIGCAMSNIALWDKVIETGQPLTICDDDTIFNHQFELQAEQVLSTLPPDWHFVLWGWNFDSFFCFEMLPGVSSCLALFEQDRLIPNVEVFQHQTVSPRVYRLLWAWGHPCYTVSPRGARELKSKLLPFRPMVIPCPEGYKRRPCPPYFTVTGMDGALNGIYRDLNAFACFPPLVVTKNEHASSTIQPPESGLHPVPQTPS
jgi:glycosyl transferase, family 25